MNGGRTVGDATNGELGAATLWAAGAIAALCAVAALLLSIVSDVAVRHRITAAADLAALAAAARAPDGAVTACGAARWVVRNMHAELARCELSGWDARVEVRAPIAGIPGWPGTVRAHARAGPGPST